MGPKSADINDQVQKRLHDLYIRDKRPLSTICEDVEVRLREMVQIASIGQMRSFLMEAGKPTPNQFQGYFAFEGVNYEIRTEVDPNRGNRLNIIIRSTDIGQARFERKGLSITVDTIGRYNEVCVRTAPAFASQRLGLGEIAQTTLEAGYRWLEEHVHKALITTQCRGADNLYSQIRMMFPPSIAEGVLLLAFTGRTGAYIHDQRTLNSVTQKISSAPVITTHSSLEKVVSLVTSQLPIEETFSQIAFSEKRPIEGGFCEVQYGGSLFAIAEQSVLTCERAVVYPLVSEGKTLLCAVYPVEMRQKIEPILSNERGKFKAIVDQDAATIQQMLRHLRTQGSLPGLPVDFYQKFGEFIGGLVKPYLSP